MTSQDSARADGLIRNRNAVVARSFYRQLRAEGFSPQQIIDLSSALLALVSEEIGEGRTNTAK